MILLIIIILFFLSVLFLNFKIKQKDFYNKYFVLIFITLVFFLQFLLSSFWGNWNTLKSLNNSKVYKIEINQFFPKNVKFVLTDTIVIENITSLLKNTNVYFPSHPQLIWKMDLSFFTIDKKKLKLVIEKTVDDGNIICIDKFRFKQNQIDVILEKLIETH